MKRIILILIIALPFYAKAQKIGQYTGADAVVYSMPVTSVKITVKVETEMLKAGPYAEYADMFLSMSDAVRTDRTTYNIKSIKVEPSVEADYENSYALPLTAMKGGGNIFKLTKLGVMLTNENLDANETKHMHASEDFKLFRDRLPSSPMESKRVTTYNRVKTDSGFMQVPYSQSVTNEKNPEAKAEEAAKFLFSLRQRRFELVTGDVEGAFSGSSMKDAIKEINRLEKEYLSLFLGKTSTNIKEYTFYIAPQQSRNKSTYNVFRFSRTKGIIYDIDLREGLLVTLDVTPEGRVESGIKDINTASKGTLIYYKVPDFAKIQLMQEGEELCNERMPIYQFGKTLTIPSEAIFNAK